MKLRQANSGAIIAGNPGDVLVYTGAANGWVAVAPASLGLPPAGVTNGQVLWWDQAAGEYKTSGAPGSPGTATRKTFLTWNGAGYSTQLIDILPQPDADGRLLYAKAGAWVRTPAPLVGQVAWFDGSDWVFTSQPLSVGDVLRWSVGAQLEYARGGGQLSWGDGALGTGTNDRYPSVGWDMSTGANTTLIEFRMTRACRTRGFYFIAQTHVGGADAELTATILKNGVATAHVLVIPAATLSFEDDAPAVDWAAGDRCSLLCTRADPSNPGDYVFTLGML